MVIHVNGGGVLIDILGGFAYPFSIQTVSLVIRLDLYSRTSLKDYFFFPRRSLFLMLIAFVIED